MNIRELEVRFTKKGILYSQEMKNDKIVIYRCKNLDSQDEYFEVFRYRLGKPHPMDAGNWDMVELYPSDNAFGVWAWCCNTNCLGKVLKKHF